MGSTKTTIVAKEGFWEEAFEIAKWYEDEVYGLGDGFLEEVYDAINTISKHPKVFAAIRKNSAVRRYIIERFSHKLYYSHQSGQITLLAVIHKSRSNKFIKRRLR